MLFDIDDADWVSLDRAESRGVGYERMSVEVEPRDGSRLLISAYFARDDHIDSRLKPYTWYRDLVVAGAREHDLPAAYIVRIENEPAVPDTNLEREAAMRGLLDADP